MIVSTDVGGTDPDDFQSLVHLLLYTDTLELEGLISSPFGPGRKEHILQVIDVYERDYGELRTHSKSYPAPDALRLLTKQGETEVAPHRGYRSSTAGSQWIVRAARRPDPRPLHLLAWGGIEDLAQALRDAPDILPKLRVYWIGGPNKKWSPDAFSYILRNHPQLNIIESNASYRGWFVGGDQSSEWSNTGFVSAHIARHGALGAFFAEQLGGSIKMGDSPSVGWLLRGNPADPSAPGWGGRFVRAWRRPSSTFHRLTTQQDQIPEFGIFELALPLAPPTPEAPVATLEIGNQSLRGDFGREEVRFRFSPKAAKVYRYVIRSNVRSLDGRSGMLTAVQTASNSAERPDPGLPHWWTDDPRPEFAEGTHLGARTVSRWRRDFLADFAARMDRCQPGPAKTFWTRADR